MACSRKDTAPGKHPKRPGQRTPPVPVSGRTLANRRDSGRTPSDSRTDGTKSHELDNAQADLSGLVDHKLSPD